MDLHAFVAGLPKVDLHCHIADAIPAPMLFDIAAANGIALAPFTPETIYRSTDFEDYLERLALVCSVLSKQADFRLVLFEALRNMASRNIRYCELFFNPDDHPVSYPAMLDAYCDAIDAAERSFGIRARLIPSINRALGPQRGLAMVENVIRNRHAHVVGIGLDNNEMLGPPRHYVEAFNLARAHGLHVSAHAGERFDPVDLRDAVDFLGIERIDHGYSVVEDAELLAQLRDAGTPFTTCWSACVLVRGEGSAITEMLRAGLNVTINTDAPASFTTDINREYLQVVEAMNFGPAEISAVARAGVLASYLPESDKRILLSDLAAYAAQPQDEIMQDDVNATSDDLP
ncbi:adenosine deaminase [Mesorhizobium neociceri]|uniref:Adenosine deaminase n=1 Tax=Mesorhizobium neociceri TaxID=1307853 RepID=A0A838B4N4_9HYPH|nr:adenosine deaminase [Mesorhizobium neociceri]MBA1140961.1 adenosine deaminase [Mesorhizobium neociceri]